jgi:dipeptidyl aminopeptidase/acylaminoacyl peptidase
MLASPPRPVVLVIALAALGAGPGALAAQQPPSTDIYLAPLTVRGTRVELGTPVNVTRRQGYDNQPRFSRDGGTLYFTSVRGAAGSQADIWRLDLASGEAAPFTETPESEYSPTVTPDGRALSVVRVERDSAQRLWRFPLDGGRPTLVLEHIKPVGYHAWLDAHILALFVLGDPNTLQLADTRTGRADTVARGVGRTLAQVPGKRALGLVQKRGPHDWWLASLFPATRTVTPLVKLPDGVEDFAWLPDGSAIVGQGSRLLRWRSGGQWEEVADLGSSGVESITRIAVSPMGDRIAVVGADSR